MPARLGRPRPPLPRFAVAWFPAFEGLERIEAFRARHDPMAMLVPAHLTLVFPFATAQTALQVSTHVQRVVSRFPPIAIAFRPVRLFANEFVFLMATHGAPSVAELHDRLYTRSLRPKLRRDLTYEPHITIAQHGPRRARSRARGGAGALPRRIPRRDPGGVGPRGRARR